MFGVLGPALVRYNAFALTLDVGWFGACNIDSTRQGLDTDARLDQFSLL